MASYGLIGAIGGAAQGFGNALQFELEESRKMRLEEVRAKNTRELNREKNQQRHEFSLAELAQRGEQQEGLLNRSDELARDRAEWQMGLEPNETWADETLDGMPGQRSTTTGKFNPFPRSADADNRSSQGKQIRDLMDLDLTQDEALSLVYPSKGKELTPESFRVDLARKLSEKEFLGPDEIEERINRAVALVFPENQDTAPPPAPQAAIQALMENRDRADEFEAYYGYLPEGFERNQGGDRPATQSQLTAKSAPPSGSLDERMTRAVGDFDLASIDSVGSLQRPSSLNAFGTEAQIAFRQAKATVESLSDIPIDVLKDVLPYLTGKEADEVVQAIAAQSR